MIYLLQSFLRAEKDMLLDYGAPACTERGVGVRRPGAVVTMRQRRSLPGNPGPSLTAS